MSTYRIKITPKSAFSTPLHSDTLFGHLCWAIRYCGKQKDLEEFLYFLKEDPSIFILSSGFPSGYLPRPALRPLSPEEQAQLVQAFPCPKDEDPLTQFASRMKDLKRIQWIPAEILYNLKNGLSPLRLFEEMMSKGLEPQRMWEETQEWHTAKNRRTDQVIKGRLFAKEALFSRRDFEIYQVDNYFGKDKLTSVWKFVGETGYGADSSTGKGHFEVELEEFRLEGANDPNAFVLFSHTIPSADDPREGYYDILTKFGKLGANFAPTGRVFKRPVIMLLPGATFSSRVICPFYGRIVEGVHHEHGEVVQYGLSLPFPVRLI